MARTVDLARTLTVACVHCGQPIVLVTHNDGVQIPDRDGFLRLHGGCLAAAPQAAEPQGPTPPPGP